MPNAAVTYYYFLSILLVISITCHTANMLLFRTKHRSFLGRYKTGTLEDKRLRRFSNNRSFSIYAILLVIFVANLVACIRYILSLNGNQYPHSIIIYAPIASVLLTVSIAVYIHREYANYGISDK
jgi:hypothetical protein